MSRKRLFKFVVLLIAFGLLTSILYTGYHALASSNPPTQNGKDNLNPETMRQPLGGKTPVMVGTGNIPIKPNYVYGSWQVAADSPFAYTRFDGEYSYETGKVYFLGGRLSDNTTVGHIWSFDPVSGVYTDTGKDLTTPVSNYTIARLTESGGAEILVIIGGRMGTGTQTQSVQGYYPSTNTTVVFPTADNFPIATSPGSVAVVNNIAYVMGGFNGTSMTAATYIFDISKASGSRWTVGPNLGLARSYMPTAVVDGVIYVMGGDTYDGTALIPQSKTEKLDTNTLPLTWDDAGFADLPKPCDEVQAFGFDSTSAYDLAGAIVMAGCGQWNGTPSELPDSMLYNVATNTWDTTFPPLNEARRNNSGVFVPNGAGGNGNPGIWVFGGRQALDTNILAIPEFYDVIPLGPFTLLPKSQTVTGNVGWTDVNLTAFNQSGSNDIFDLAYQGTETWAISGPGYVSVDNQKSTPFTFQVEIPTGSACFASNDITITGTSQTTPEIFNTATAKVMSGGAWQEQTTTSPGGHWMAYTCTDLVGTKGTCFYFGGLQGPGTGQGVVGDTRIYDIASGTWSAGGDLPVPVFGAVAGAINTPSGVRIYVAGGFNGSDFTSVTDALQIYDPAANSWSLGPVLPVARGGVGGGAVNGYLFVIGGQDSTYSYAYNHVYDPITNAWYEKTSFVTVVSGYYPSFFGSATTTSKLYVGGDYFGSTTFVEYDPGSDTWTQRANIPSNAGQKSPVGAGVGNQVFWFGGNTDNWNNILDSTWMWDPIRDFWVQSAATLNTAVTGGGGGTADGKLWAFGGSQGNGSIEPPPHESAPPCVPPLPPVGALDGMVLDANTSLGIDSAYVYLESQADNAIYSDTRADAGGNYFLPNLLPGDYYMYADARYYETSVNLGEWPTGAISVTIRGDETAIYNVSLNASQMDLTPENGFSVILGPGGSSTEQLKLTNNGTAPLRFSLSLLDSAVPEPPLAPAAIEPGARIDEKLFQDFRASPDGNIEFLILLNGTANLSAVNANLDWNTRGQLVYDTLKQYGDAAQFSIRRYLDSQSVQYTPLYVVNGILVKAGNEKLVNELATRSDVLQILANHPIPVEDNRLTGWDEILQSQNVPNAVEWNINKVGADKVWDVFGVTGEGIVVAEVDTGTQWDHPALQPQYRGWNGVTADHNYNWFDPYAQCPDSGKTPCDDRGHGTHVMGTMVGDDGGTNQIGMAPGAKWIACKGGDSISGYLMTNELLQCAEWIVAPTDSNGNNPNPAMRPNIVNNSWGGGPDDYWFSRAIDSWRAAGIFPAFANGNAGPGCSTAHSPGDNWNAFASGATDNTDTIAGFSSRGPSAVYGTLKPNISSPGANIRSSVPGNSYALYSGTSMASPHTAGAVALLWSAQPELIGQIDLTGWVLEQSALPLYTEEGCGGDSSTSHPNNTYGWGRLNIYDAINLARTVPQTPDWVSASLLGGTINPGETVAVDLTFTPPADFGTYQATLWLVADDPYNPDVRLPLVLSYDWWKIFLPTLWKLIP